MRPATIALYIFILLLFTLLLSLLLFQQVGLLGPDGKALLVQDSVQRRINPYADQTVSSTPMNATSTVATVVSVSQINFLSLLSSFFSAT